MYTIKSESGSKPVECPFCRKGSVLASVMTHYCFRAEHGVYTDGIDIDGNTIGQILGDFCEKPIIHINKFRCVSCNKEWSKSEYKLEKDENGMLTFVKQEKKKQR